MTSTRTIIVLVHGTFAKEAAWTLADSRLSRAIREALPQAEVHRFQWTGKNSHAQRARASVELDDYLKDLVLSRDKAKLFIIAHSHGGNVVLAALRDKAVRDCVRGVICMATPFIHFEPRNVQDAAKILRLTLPAVCALIALPLFMAVSMPLLDILEPMIGPIVYVLLLITQVLAGTFVIIKTFRRAQGFVDAHSRHSAPARQRQLEDLLNPINLEVPVVCAMVARDEAAFTLTWSYRVGEVPQMIWPFLVALLKASLAAIVLAIPFDVVLDAENRRAIAEEIYAGLFIWLVMASGMWISLMVAIPFIARGLFVYGEQLSDNVVARIFSEALPSPSVKNAYALPVKMPIGPRLRHSGIYGHPPFIRDLTRLIFCDMSDDILRQIGAIPSAIKRAQMSTYWPRIVAITGVLIYVAVLLLTGGCPTCIY